MSRGELFIELSAESAGGAYWHGEAHNDAPLCRGELAHAGNIGPASERKHMLVGIDSAPGDEFASDDARLSDRRLGFGS
jgi:hypothetical protein